tara:strand:+ start:8922 stop:9164 length:243 start_codon:yes stop_codon:yes gene_type:complete
VSALGSEGKVEDQASLGWWGGTVACAYLLGIGGLLYGAEIGGTRVWNRGFSGRRIGNAGVELLWRTWNVERRLCNFKHKK